MLILFLLWCLRNILKGAHCCFSHQPCVKLGIRHQYGLWLAVVSVAGQPIWDYFRQKSVCRLLGIWSLGFDLFRVRRVVRARIRIGVCLRLG